MPKSNGGNVEIKITGEDSELQKTLSGAKGKAEAALGAAGKGAKIVTGAVAAIGSAALAAGAAIAQVGGDFETAFAQVKTIMDPTQKSMEDMREEILALSEDTRIAATELSGSVYNAISATGDTANSVQLVGSAVKLSKAGFTDTQSALGVLTTAMNAYGLSADQAMAISDSLIKTQNLGVTTIAELSSVMGKAIASASAYGIDLSNVEASYISMTKAGINTAESTTYMSSMFKELGDDGSEASKILKKATGETFAEMMRNGKSVGDVLGVIYDALGQDSTAMMNMWGSAEAGKAANAIINQGLEAFNANVLAVKDSAGLTEQAYATMADTVQAQTEGLKNSIKNFGISLFDAYKPQISQTLTDINGWMRELMDAYERGGVTATGDAASAIAPKLIEKLAGMMSKATASIAKKLPDLVKNLMSAIPGILSGSGIGTLVPQIVEALFGAAGSAVESLIGMLPQLAPEMLKGFANLFKSVATGADKLAEGLFNGIAQAFHQGKTQIMGVWVDTETSANIAMQITGTVDTEPAETAASEAWQRVRDALSTPLLTEAQKDEILGMIGEDYDAIKQKLISFGLSAEDAEPIAKAVTDAGDAIGEIFGGLDVGVDAGTIAKWTVQSNGSRIVLKGILKDAGLEQGDIDEILRVFDDNAAALGGGAPSLFSEIYDKLTDGVPDSDAQTDEFVQRANDYYGGMLEAIQNKLNEDIAALDVNDPEYAQKLASLKSEAEAASQEVKSLQDATVTYITAMSGQSTETVQAHMDELVALEQRVSAVIQQLNKANEEATSADQNAFQAVRAGATTDEVSIGRAINLKFTEFKLDTQAAEDAYQAGIEELQAQLARGEITAEQSKAQETQLQTAMEDAKNAAKAAYERALGEIFTGIAEAEGNREALDKALEASDAKQAINDALTKVFTESGEIDRSALDGLSEKIQGVLGDAFSPEQLAIAATYDMEDFQNLLDVIGAKIDAASSESMKTALGGKLGEAYAGALDAMALAGTSFDTTNAEAQIAAMLGAIYTNAGAQAQNQASTVGSAVSGAAVDALDDGGAAETQGSNFGAGFAAGIRSKKNAAVNAAVALVAAAIRAVRQEQDSHSPAKRLIKEGKNFGAGYRVGIEESMQDAIRVARRMTGELVSASALGSASRGVIRIEAGGEPMQVAMDTDPTPVNLDGRQIAEIQGLSNSSVIAFNNTQHARGVGGR